MRERTLWIVLILIILLSAVAGGVYTFYRNNLKQPSGNSNSQAAVGMSTTTPTVSAYFQSATPAPLQSTSPQGSLRRTGWIPDWDWVKGYDAVKANPQGFDSISPVWYYVDKNGNIRANRTGLSEFQALTRAKKIKLIPSIASFDSIELHNMLGDEAKVTAHIEYLKNEVTKYGFDGLDIDYESIQLDDQQAFLRIMRELYEFLHPQGKTLSIAIMTTYTDADILRSGRQTRHTQAWQEVGNYVHEFRLMTYDMTGNKSQYPGPIAPLDWQEAVLRYTVPRVDPSKIMLGINLYAYGGWGDNLTVPQPYLSQLSNPWLEKGQASALLYTDILARKANTVSNTFDAINKEKVLRYRREGKEYLAYYMDAETVGYRHNLAKLYNIGGVAYWRLGGEDPAVHRL